MITHAIFIFRRSLRLVDNLGLIEALKNSQNVIPIFILTKEQLDQKQNKYFSNNCVQFMMESLNELDNELDARNLNFVRYADDCIILVKSEKAANRIMKSVSKHLEEKLGLKSTWKRAKLADLKELNILGLDFIGTDLATNSKLNHM